MFIGGCPACWVDFEPMYDISYLPVMSIKWRAKGCDRCFNTGYQGRTGIFEFMQIDPTMRTVLLKNPDATTIRGYAVNGGMKTIREDGLEKAAAGVTSLEEVLRVTQID